MKNIFVGDLDFGATEESIRQLFEKYGRVEDVFVEVDRETGSSHGFAVVEMGSDADVERVTAHSKAQLNGVKLNGPELTLNEETVSRGAYPLKSRAQRESSARSLQRR